MKLTKKQMLIRKAPATALNQTSATDEDSCRKTTSKIDPVLSAATDCRCKLSRRSLHDLARHAHVDLDGLPHLVHDGHVCPDVKHSLTRRGTSSLASTGDLDLHGRRLFLARCCFRGLLPLGPGSDRSLGLRLMVILHARPSAIVIGWG